MDEQRDRTAGYAGANSGASPGFHNRFIPLCVTERELLDDLTFGQRAPRIVVSQVVGSCPTLHSVLRSFRRPNRKRRTRRA